MNEILKRAIDELDVRKKNYLIRCCNEGTEPDLKDEKEKAYYEYLREEKEKTEGDDGIPCIFEMMEVD